MILDEWFLSRTTDWIRTKNPTYVASLSRWGTRKTIRKIQSFKLRKTVRQVYARSDFYRRVFQENGIKPSDIKSPSDITKLPFTTSLDLLRDPYAFLTVPREKIVHIFTSAGTTGSSKKLFFTEKDMESMIQICAVGCAAQRVGVGDTVQIMFAYGRPSWGTGTIVERGTERVGATVVAAGNSLTSEEQIQLMKEFGSTFLCGYPAYLHRITEEGKKDHNLAQFGIRGISLGAAPWPESLRTFLEENWKTKVYDGYGLTEMGYGVAGECLLQNGLHLNELDFLFEIVDPSTGEQLPPGETGELVITTVNREGMPLIRYRTHDITKLIEEPCSCGVNTLRIGRINGRSDDMVIVGTGENIFPNMFDQAILGIEGVLEYQIILEKEGFQDKITAKVETNQRTEDMKEKLVKALLQIAPIAEDIAVTRTIAEPRVELLEPGTLIGANGIKVRKILDKR